MTEQGSGPRLGWLGTGRMGAVLVTRLLAGRVRCGRLQPDPRPSAAAG